MNKYIEALDKLAKENHEIDIIFLTDTTICEDTTYSYWIVKKDIVWENKGHPIMGEPEIKERAMVIIACKPIIGENKNNRIEQ